MTISSSTRNKSKSKSSSSSSRKSFLSTLPSQRRLLRRQQQHHQQLLLQQDDQKRRDQKKRQKVLDEYSQEENTKKSRDDNKKEDAIKREDDMDASIIQKINASHYYPITIEKTNYDDTTNEDSNDGVVQETEEYEERMLLEDISNRCYGDVSGDGEVGGSKNTSDDTTDEDGVEKKGNVTNSAETNGSAVISCEFITQPPPSQQRRQSSATSTDKDFTESDNGGDTNLCEDIEVVEGTILPEEDLLLSSTKSPRQRLEEQNDLPQLNPLDESVTLSPPAQSNPSQSSLTVPSSEEATQNVTSQIKSLIESVVQQQTSSLRYELENMRYQLQQQEQQQVSYPQDRQDNMDAIRQLKLDLKYAREECKMERERNKILEENLKFYKSQVGRFQALFRQSQAQLEFERRQNKREMESELQLEAEDELGEVMDGNEEVSEKNVLHNKRAENGIEEHNGFQNKTLTRKEYGETGAAKDHTSVTMTANYNKHENKAQSPEREKSRRAQSQNSCSTSKSTIVASSSKRKKKAQSLSSSQNMLKSIAASARRSVTLSQQAQKKDSRNGKENERRRRSFPDCHHPQQEHERQEKGANKHLSCSDEMKQGVDENHNVQVKKENCEEENDDVSHCSISSSSFSSAINGPSMYTKKGRSSHQTEIEEIWVGQNVVINRHRRDGCDKDKRSTSTSSPDVVISSDQGIGGHDANRSPSCSPSNKEKKMSNILFHHDDQKILKGKRRCSKDGGDYLAMKPKADRTSANDGASDHSRKKFSTSMKKQQHATVTPDIVSSSSMARSRNVDFCSANDDATKANEEVGVHPRPGSNTKSHKPAAVHNPYQKITPPPRHHKRNNREATTNISNKEDQQPYKYKEVVRCRDKRRAMPGHVCEHCVKFIDAVCGPAGNEGDIFDRNQMIMDCSRHRARHSPEHTPDGFWELSFADEIAARRKGEEELQRMMEDD